MKEYYNTDNLYIGTIEYISNVRPFAVETKRLKDKFIFEKVKVYKKIIERDVNVDTPNIFERLTRSRTKTIKPDIPNLEVIGEEYKEIFTDEVMEIISDDQQWSYAPYISQIEPFSKYFPDSINEEVSKLNLLLAFDKINNIRIGKGPIKRKKKQY